MSKLTKRQYDELMEMPKDYLTQENLNDIHEYESSEAGAPSNEELQWARNILNEKDPQIQSAFRESGDLDKAMSILKQKKAADELMVSRDQDPYIKKVKSTPEDVVEKSGFQFNWRDAYEQSKGEKLKATEADAKKLQDFINSNMYNVNDDVSLKHIAYNLHMYNPNTMKWSDFINSEQGDEFKKYLEDVRKAQTEKAVDDIWEGKDDKTVGDKASTWAVNFMLPVSKEYARNHYNDKDFSLAGPLAFDTAANIVMTGPGAAEVLPAKAAVPVSKVMNRPLVSFLYGNVAAPAITETGNAIWNDESVPEALARTVEGTAINIGTPRILENMLSSAGRGIPNGNNRSVQKMLDEAANKAAKVYDDIDKGKPYAYYVPEMKKEFMQNTKNGRVMYTIDPAKSQAEHEAARAALGKNKDNITYKSLEEMPPESINVDEWKSFMQGLPFVRGKAGNTEFAQKIKQIQDIGKEYLTEDLLIKKAESLAKDGDLRNLTPVELRQLGFPDKESFMNYLIRTIKVKIPSTVSTYMTNAAGRPEFGREAGPIENINRLLGTSLFTKDKTNEEKDKSRIQRLLGL